MIKMLDTQSTTVINQELEKIVEGYRHFSVSELKVRFSIETEAKHGLSMLVERLFVTSGLSDLIKENTHKSLRLKAVRTDMFGRLKESISLPAFRYCDIIQEIWDTSTLRKYFSDNLFIFTVFQYRGRELYLRKIILWEMPEDILDTEVHRVWDETRTVLLQGKIVKYIDANNRFFTHFPTSTSSFCVHVRPHAQSKHDTYPLPVPDILTGAHDYPKHSFWLNSSFIKKIIS